MDSSFSLADCLGAREALGCLILDWPIRDSHLRGWMKLMFCLDGAGVPATQTSDVALQLTVRVQGAHPETPHRNGTYRWRDRSGWIRGNLDLMICYEMPINRRE